MIYFLRIVFSNVDSYKIHKIHVTLTKRELWSLGMSNILYIRKQFIIVYYKIWRYFPNMFSSAFLFLASLEYNKTVYFSVFFIFLHFSLCFIFLSFIHSFIYWLYSPLFYNSRDFCLFIFVFRYLFFHLIILWFFLFFFTIYFLFWCLFPQICMA